MKEYTEMFPSKSVSKGGIVFSHFIFFYYSNQFPLISLCFNDRNSGWFFNRGHVAISEGIFVLGASMVAQMVKNLPAMWETRVPGEGTGNPLQYSCLENLMVRGAWRTMGCGWMLQAPSEQRSGILQWMRQSPAQRIIQPQMLIVLRLRKLHGSHRSSVAKSFRTWMLIPWYLSSNPSSATDRPAAWPWANYSALRFLHV